MDLDRWLGQLRRGTLDLCVLRVLSHGEAHGYEIVQRLKQARFLTIREGTVYPVLQRLLKGGLVRVRPRRSQVGPPRRCFMLTAQGRTVLAEMDERWSAFVSSADSLTKEEPKR